MGFLSAIGGAVSGFIGSGGNPLGAIAGGLSGLGGDGRTQGQGQNQSQNSTSTTNVNLRKLTKQEQAMQDSAYQGIASNQMTPEQLAQMQQQAYGNIFNPAVQQLNQTYATQNAQNYGDRARRGAGNTSAGVGQDRASVAAQGRDTGNLSMQAQQMATQQRMAQEENMRANQASYMNQINSMWSNRLQSSGSTTTSKGTASAQQTNPSTFWDSVAGGVGSGIANGFSLSNIFGGGGTEAKPSGNSNFYNAPAGPSTVGTPMGGQNNPSRQPLGPAF